MKNRQFFRILFNLSVLFLISFNLKSVPVFGNEDFCTGEWIWLHRACYRFHKEKSTWDDAKQTCEQEGGYLVSISSMAEKKKIKKQLSKEITLMSEQYWWIGLRYDRRVNKWLWEDGGEFNEKITRWVPGEPNNGHLEEVCAQMKFDGDLMNMNCGGGYPYICEKNKITLPPTSSTAVVSSSTEVPQYKTKSHYVTRNTTISFTEKTVHSEISTILFTDIPKSSKQTTDIVITTPRGSKTTTTENFPNTPSTILNDVCYVESSKNGKQGHPHDYRFCRPTRALNINWPRIKAGTLAKMPCRQGTGFAYWLCGKEPTCWRDEPDVTDCASVAFQDVLEQIDTTNNGSAPTEKEALIVTSALVNITSATESMTTEDMLVTTEVLNNVAKTKPKDKKVAKQIVEQAVQIGSNLLSNNQTDTWESMEEKDRLFSASSIMHAMENVTMAMAVAIDEPAVITVNDENMEMKLLVLDVETLGKQNLIYGGNNSGAFFSIPTTALKENSEGNLVKVIFMTHYTVGTFLQEDDKRSTPKPRVASQVVSASLSSGVTNMSEPVTFILKLTTVMKSGFRPLCSFWKFTTGYAGDWSQEGCEVHSYNSTDVTCKCSHLTNFAVLMNVEPVEMAEVHVMSLRYITFVGCAISIICLFASWLTFQCFGAIHGERNSIHKHLVCCLFIAEIAFLAGIDKTDNEIACAVIAGLLHYFFLAAFVWMFLEGVHIVMMLVKVFDASSSRMCYYYFIGYGTPLIIVGITAGLRYDGYGTPSFCWLSTDKFLIWSFAGPVAFILLVNAVILTYAMTTVCKHSEYVFQREKGAGGNMKAWIQGALALEVLLGLTWGFGYFFISQETIVMAYIFTVFNSLQGLFIFLFHCLLNKKVRKEYKKCLHIKEKSKTSTTTKSGSIRKPSTSYEMYNSSKT